MNKSMLFTACALLLADAALATSWTADNGNGTYTNPLFYDEFSDPDIIRVGEDYYLAGTTMHSVPGVVVLHSKDLVNWEWLSYCFDQYDMGPQFALENGQEIYGQGIWAPCIRYNDGKFYIFSNINGVGLQLYTADDPAGPWEHKNLGGDIYDLSVLFDDDGKIYAVYHYGSVNIIEMKPDLSGYIEGTKRTVIPEGNAMGEGHHIYKIDGKYYILSADYAPQGRMQCARAENIDGPWETRTICTTETLGLEQCHWVDNVGLGSPVPGDDFEFKISDPRPNNIGGASIHQGGIVQLPNGDWWGLSMMDHKAIGRTTCLSPITWVDGWPYFGLPNNLGRVPRTWTKPDTGADVAPSAPYVRCDDFNGKKLQPIWQWNHDPKAGKWALKKGQLQICAMPAKDFLWARNTLTQRAIGPESVVTVEVDASKLKDGDKAGLGLLNMPYAWIGLVRDGKNLILRQHSQNGNLSSDLPAPASKAWLRVHLLTDDDVAQYSYSFDGELFENIGEAIILPYQLKTFQGPRYSLFAFNDKGQEGGIAYFDNFTVEEPQADRSANVPIGKTISLVNKADGHRLWAWPHGMLYKSAPGSPEYDSDACKFLVHDRGNGLVALEALNGTGFITVVGEGLAADVRLCPQESPGSLFMWQDMLHGDCMLLSLKTHRCLGTDVTTGEPYSANFPGASPSRKNGCVFQIE